MVQIDEIQEVWFGECQFKTVDIDRILVAVTINIKIFVNAGKCTVR